MVFRGVGKITFGAKRGPEGRAASAHRRQPGLTQRRHDRRRRRSARRGAPWRWSAERYGELLRVTGGFERLLFDLQTQPPVQALDEGTRRMIARRIHAAKNGRHAELVSSGALPLRPWVRGLLDECSARGLRTAVITATSRGSVEALLSAHLGSD